MALRSFFEGIGRKAALPWWFCAPLLFSVATFLVAHNNTSRGRAVVVTLLALNATFCVIPFPRFVVERARGAFRLGAVCALSCLGSILVIEVCFPLLAPAEHAAIRELAKGPQGKSLKDATHYPIVFSNGDQRMWLRASAGALSRVEHLYWHVPGKEFEYYGYEPNDKYGYVNIVRWNSDGYYDHDHDRPKPAGVQRILFIGDSFVESVQVPLARTFHKLLERALNERLRSLSKHGRERVEIAALGNSGTGQAVNLKILNEEGWSYEPDAVVFTLCHNDFCDDDAGLRRERSIALGEITPEIRNLARHGLYFPALALKRYQEYRMRSAAPSPELLQWRDETIPRVEAAWDKTLSCIEQAAKECGARGIPFFLVWLGSELELDYALRPRETLSRLAPIRVEGPRGAWDPTRSERRVAAFCSRKGINFISLVGPLVEAQKTSGKKVFGDHYTMFGHEAAARALFEAFAAHERPVLAGGVNRVRERAH
jgi:hypothetical protein